MQDGYSSTMPLAGYRTGDCFGFDGRGTIGLLQVVKMASLAVTKEKRFSTSRRAEE